MTVLAMDTICHLPITSNCNWWALILFCLHTSYIFAAAMKERSAENVIQAYLSNILTHKGESVAILSDKGKKFTNKMLNEVCDQLDIKMLFASPFHPQGTAKVENIQNFLKSTLTKLACNSDLQ